MRDEDFVAAFQLNRAPVRGRAALLGLGVLDPILKRHDYSRPVAALLGEALTLAALVNSLFKTEGRLIVQAEGDGPVSLLVAEARSDGGVRGYARAGPSAPTEGRFSPRALLGENAVLTLTVDPGPGATQVQGAAPLEGETLAACAEAFFERSEQVPTRVRLAVVEELTGEGGRWRSGGVLLQRVAGDEARGSTDEDWRRAQILFETLEDAELGDPALPIEQILYRLFHEEGVRLSPSLPLADRCTCDPERLAALLRRMDREELETLKTEDGAISARCQFCSRLYLLDPADL